MLPSVVSRRNLLRVLGGLGAAPLLAGRVPPAQSAPAGGNGSLRFLAVADTGSGNANQFAVGEQMAARHRLQAVDLVLMGGDNIYPAGNLLDVERTFQRPYRELLSAGVPFHAVLGNHDIRTDNGDPQVRYRPFGMANRWYSLRRGPVAFFLLDTNVNARWQHQMPWLKKALAASDAPWKVVVGHHPLYSAGLYGDDPAAIARLTPLFERHGVQLYINGHEHNYERTRRIRGTTYLTVGGGGAWLRPVVANARSARAISTYSFAELHVVGDSLTLDAWNLRGERIDRAVLPRLSA
ncbi:MAG: metallophosphoesterase family protein [Synechococcaceae cyanobacterium]